MKTLGKLLILFCLWLSGGNGYQVEPGWVPGENIMYSGYSVAQLRMHSFQEDGTEFVCSEFLILGGTVKCVELSRISDYKIYTFTLYCTFIISKCSDENSH
jgi:hypothetical protein